MFLSLFLPSALSLVKDYCTPEMVAPTAIPNMTLQYFQVLFDPGLITPEVPILSKDRLGNWVCNKENNSGYMTRTAPSIQYRHYNQVIDEIYAEFPKNCRCNDLTTAGRKHVNQLGALYREYLINKTGYLPAKLNPKYFRFFSAPDDCCVNSAHQFIDGLYPPENDNEVLYLETASEQNSPLVLSQTLCQDLVDLYNEFNHSQLYNDTYESVLSVVGGAVESVGLEKTNANAYAVCKWALSMNCNSESQLPSDFSDDVINKCLELKRFETTTFYSHDTSRIGVAAAPIMRHLFKYADKGIGYSTGVKMSIESVRNNVIASIVSLSGNDFDIPIGSHLAVEVWENFVGEANPPQQYIRFVLNGKPITLLSTNQEYMKYDDFRATVYPLVYEYCPEQNIYNQ